MTYFNSTPEAQAERAAVRAAVAPLAQSMGVDVETMTGAALYLKRVASEASPEQQAIIQANPTQFIQEGIKHYTEQATKFYADLLANPAKMQALSQDLYVELRRRQGLSA